MANEIALGVDASFQEFIDDPCEEELDKLEDLFDFYVSPLF
jgi:hypothetical protein